jgi:hypothetical protein
MLFFLIVFVESSLLRVNSGARFFGLSLLTGGAETALARPRGFGIIFAAAVSLTEIAAL